MRHILILFSKKNAITFGDGIPFSFLLLKRSSSGMALDSKATRWELPRSLNREPSLVGEFSKLRERAVLASQQDQLQRERGHAVLW
jgi:hypothetical protein